MRKFGLAVALVLLSTTLGSCASLNTIKQTWDAAKNVVVNKNGVVIAVQTFNAAERTATVYLNQKKCPRNVQRPTCRSPAITEAIATAITEGQRARDGLLDFAEGHPGAIGDQGLYDALRGSIGTLKSFFAAYKIIANPADKKVLNPPEPVPQ